jgi:glycosyltransferase involved in cell wall biosynthesis
MPRVLLLRSEPDPSAGWKQFALARPLLPERFAFVELPFRSGTPGVTALRESVTREKPDILHTFGPGAFKTARRLSSLATLLGPLPKWIVSGAAECGAEWSRPLLPEIDAAVTFSAHECGRVSEQMTVRCVHMFDPAVEEPRPTTAPVGLPSKFILAAGGFDDTADLKAAVWAFEMMKYADPELHLVLLGEGPGRPDLERFARHLAWDDYRIHFAGWQDDVAPYLSAATAVWVTHAGGGRKLALEAMAAGKAVVAVRTADTESVIEHEVTGLLVPGGDKVALAAVTRKLLADSGRAGRLGCAAREKAAGFSPRRLAEAFTAAYDRLTRTPPG